MTLFSSYDQVGKKEDVSDIISNISPAITPFQTMIRKGKVTNDIYQWQEDSLAAVRDNANVEGADAVDATRAPTEMRSNRTQIFESTVKVSGTADAIATYGRGGELAYQTMKASKEVKRDVEHALVGRAQNATAGDASSVAKRFGSALGQDVGSNNLIANRTTNTAVTGDALTEDMVLDMHESLFEEGADPSILMVTPRDARKVATFANAAGRERDIGNTKKVVNAVDLYVSPYGELKVVVNRFLKRFLGDEAVPPGGTFPDPATDGNTDPDSLGVAMIFDPNMWELSTLRGWSRNRLANTGDNKKWQILGEFGLKHKNYKASGLIENLA